MLEPPSLANKLLPDAVKILLVRDNLNTHQEASLDEAFPPEKARALCERFEIHDTPKHGSWLNTAEIEIGLLVISSVWGKFPFGSPYLS